MNAERDQTLSGPEPLRPEPPGLSGMQEWRRTWFPITPRCGITFELLAEIRWKRSLLG